MDQNSEIAGHYGRPALLDAIEAAISRAEPEVDFATPDAFAGYDEFHLGGRLATEALIDSLGLGSGATVLDVGCGVGGAARAIARAAGCSVVGVDLTPEFVEMALWLSGRLGMADQTDFRLGSALDLPFEADRFDAVTMLHVGMNIVDKQGLMVELARVLAPGGRLGIYDVMITGEGELDYPLPWSQTAETSFVSTPDHYCDVLIDAGLSLIGVDDRRPLVLEAIAAATEVPVPLDLGHLMGENWPLMQSNMIRAFRSGIVSPVQIVAVK